MAKIFFIGMISLSPLFSVGGERAPASRIAPILDRLETSKSGSLLLAQARTLWKSATDLDLEKYLHLSKSSRTDAVLIRRFDPKTGQESREREISIYIRAEQAADDILLDLAHELVHATSRPDWDPYDPSLTAGQYIESAIEGKGGEIEAVRIECQVGRELAIAGSHARCDQYAVYDSEKEGRQLKKDFYRVGESRDEIIQSLGAEAKRFPELSAQPVVLYSSTGQAPYPLALMQEFKAITKAACMNMSRLVDGATHAPDPRSGRSPASEHARYFLEQRCGTNPSPLHSQRESAKF